MAGWPAGPRGRWTEGADLRDVDEGRWAKSWRAARAPPEPGPGSQGPPVPGCDLRWLRLLQETSHEVRGEEGPAAGAGGSGRGASTATPEACLRGLHCTKAGPTAAAPLCICCELCDRVEPSSGPHQQEALGGKILKPGCV